MVTKGVSSEHGLEKEKSSYAEIVNDGSTPNVSTVVDGVADSEIPVEVFEDVEPLWKSFVVGFFMGDSRFIGSIHSTVNMIWSSPKSKIDVQFISKRTVFFRIDDEQMQKRVLRRKYWHIANVPLVVCEWNPETAQDPPDLSALPLWVDLMNVPCTGKFVKLHPNTERCVRMDVARVLVEVNLIKPLLQKICFRDRDQPGVTVQVNYPWLPPRCTSCDGWGHFLKDFTKIPSHNILHRGHIMEKQSKMSSSGLQSEVSGKQSDDLASGKQSADLASGKQSESLVNCEKSEISVSAGPGMGKEVVLRLLDDLSRVEVISQNQLAANSSNLNEVESGDLTKSLEEGNSIDNGSSLSPGHPKHPRPVGGVESPNGFQALRDIMEEGEIVDYEEEETHQMEEDMNGEVDIIQTNKVSDKRSQKGVAVPSGEHRLSTTQAASQKGRGKGGRKPEFPAKKFCSSSQGEQ